MKSKFKITKLVALLLAMIFAMSAMTGSSIPDFFDPMVVLQTSTPSDSPDNHPLFPLRDGLMLVSDTHRHIR